jgi:DnaJ-class molecular chaperone
MKRIIEARKLFNITKESNLTELKSLYRNLMKEWHPDKFVNDDERKEEAALKSKEIIEAYHFLISVSPETHLSNKDEYQDTITNSGIDDFEYKGQSLKVTFQNGSVYEYFGVQKNTYNKLINSDNRIRFARRHIFESYPYRKTTKASEKE